MQTGAKFLLGSVAVLFIAAGAEVAYIHHRNQDIVNAPAKTDANDSWKVSDDDLVMRKTRHPDKLTDEKELVGKTIWVAAGGQMDYYKDSGNHVDFNKPLGTLRVTDEMLVKGYFEQKAPSSGMAVRAIGPGTKHVLLAFTMPKSADPNTLYAASCGNYENGGYNFYDDQVFFYDDPHQLYKHWPAPVWASIDKHEATLGMTEAQAMMALDQVMTPHGDTAGNRSITFGNAGKPETIEFRDGKAVKITPDK